MHHYAKGIDCFTPDPGTVTDATCRACYHPMEIQRNVEAIRSYAASLTKHKELCDIFTCPNSDAEWHLQIVNLMKEQEKTASTKIKRLLQEEIDELNLNQRIKELTK